MDTVNAAKYILSCKAGWRETSKLEIEENSPRGITGLIKLIDEARAQPGYVEPSLEDLRAKAADLQTPAAPPNSARH